MKKLLSFLVMGLVLTACTHLRPSGSGRISMDEARDSVYQVQVTLTIDTSSLYAKEGGDDCDGDECTEKNGYTIVLNSDAQMATDAKIKVINNRTAQVGWVGTGWTVARDGNRSFAMTAGHVCESGNMYEVTVFDWSKLQFKSFKLPIIEKRHVLAARDGVEVLATVIADEDLDKKYDGVDLCVLGVMADLGTPIRIGDEDPKFAERAEVIGGPRGLWGGGIAVASDVKFSGRGSVFGVKPDGLTFNGEVAPGNSGSAVLYNGKAIGVISLGATRFPSLCHAVPHETMRAFLAKALHKAS